MLLRFLVTFCKMYRSTKKKCQLSCLSHALLYKYTMLNKVGVRPLSFVETCLNLSTHLCCSIPCCSFLSQPRHARSWDLINFAGWHRQLPIDRWLRVESRGFGLSYMWAQCALQA